MSPGPPSSLILLQLTPWNNLSQVWNKLTAWKNLSQANQTEISEARSALGIYYIIGPYYVIAKLSITSPPNLKQRHFETFGGPVFMYDFRTEKMYFMTFWPLIRTTISLLKSHMK